MNSLALRNDAMPETLGEIIQLGGILAASGYFQDAKSEAQAVAKLIAGREWGIGPMAAMGGIHVIQGKPAMGAGLIASQIKRSNKYDYRVREMSDQICVIDFYQGSEKIGTSSFSMEEARKAQVKNLDKFPRNMLFARAMSNGARWFTPDVFTGPVYTPEELGATVEYDTEGQERVIVEVAPQPEPEQPGASFDPSVPQPRGRPTGAKITNRAAAVKALITARERCEQLVESGVIDLAGCDEDTSDKYDRAFTLNVKEATPEQIQGAANWLTKFATANEQQAQDAATVEA
jgi:hypothetical protein